MRKDETRVKGLTLEAGLWILVGLVAFGLRAAQLDAAPLTGDEAEAAAMAWRAARGEGLPMMDYNPFLLAANSLVFFLFGASDGLARVWPMLFGSALALTPLLLSGSLGRRAALVAGAYLAISPTALVASRQVDGTVVGAVGAMVFVGGGIRWLETRRSEWLAGSAVGMALGLASGASFYGLLVPLSVVLVAMWRLWPESRAALLPEALRQTKGHRSRFLLVLLGVLLALSTGLGWNLAGLGAAGGHLAAWFARFSATGLAGASPFLLLVVYELLGFAVALAAFVWGVAEGREEPVALGLWAVMGLVLLGVMPGRAPTDLLWAVVPLALAMGVGVQALLDGERTEGVGEARLVSTQGLRLAYGVLVVILWSHGFLMLARYGYRGDRADLALALVALVVQAPLGLSAGLLLGAKRTLRTAAVATGLVLLVVTLGAGWGAAYGNPADPREPLQAQPTGLNVRDLVATLEDLSWQQTGTRTLLPFVYEAAEHSTLAWYLREFDGAERVSRLEEVGSERLGSIVVSAGRDENALGTAAERYAGQDFALTRRWSPRSLGCRFWETGCNVAVEWFLFRSGVGLPEAETWVTLWRSAGDDSSP